MGVSLEATTNDSGIETVGGVSLEATTEDGGIDTVGVSLRASTKDCGIETVAKDDTTESGVCGVVAAAAPSDDTEAESYGIDCAFTPTGGAVNTGDGAALTCAKSKSWTDVDDVVVVTARAPRGARKRAKSIFLKMKA